jgi:UDP-glucose 4-epimerase
MRIFLTGATGFLGSHVLRLLLDGGAEVAVLLSPGGDAHRIGELLGRTTPIARDLFDLEGAAREILAFRPDAVVHLAWSGVSAASRDDPGQVRNIAATTTLVELAARAGAEHWIGVGSQAEYGPCRARICEDSQARPTSLYGIAKLSACALARRLCNLSHIRFAWLRPFTVYGPGDKPSWMLPSLILQLLRGERPALTAGEQLGDYLYVEDAAEAICRTIRTPGAAGLFNLASGRPVAIRDLAEMVRDRIDPSLPIGFGEVPYRPDQIMRMDVDVSRLREATGWKPEVGLEDGLSRTIRWFRQQGTPQ